MRFSERVRLIVFSVFFVALILFAIIYQPVNAVSHPAEQKSGAVSGVAHR